MPLDDEYLEWLYSQVGSVDDEDPMRTYWALMKLLYSREFTWTNELDANRAQDGKDLRKEFANHHTRTRVSRDWLDMPCSVLEVLVGLSWKMEFEAEHTQSYWFWILIDNLGLTECSDSHPPDERIVDHILEKFMTRQYAPNGAGGLFPLQHTNEDQRNVELWYQAQAFLLARI